MTDSIIEEVELTLASSEAKKMAVIDNKEKPIFPPQIEEFTKSNEEIKATISSKKSDIILAGIDKALDFLPEDERTNVISAIQNIKLEKRTNLHPMLVAYRKKIAEWEKVKKANEAKGYYRNYNSSQNAEPTYFKEVSPESMQRVASILDVLFRTIEKLGGKVNDDLSLTIRQDTVTMHFAEAKDKVPHVMTKQEAQQMLVYKDAVKQHKWASEPKIRKYDEIYNGRLRVTFKQGKYFRDNENEKLEDRIGEMLIQLYKMSEEFRVVREKREEEHRKYLEAERIRKEKQIRYEDEVSRTKKLLNQAKDYQKACEIRSYIQAVVEHKELDEDIRKWVEWASEKADWFDPTIAKEDEFFGKREHSKSEDEKDIFNKRKYW